MPEVEVIAHVVVNRRRAPATTSNNSLQGSTRLILKGDLFPTQRGSGGEASDIYQSHILRF